MAASTKVVFDRIGEMKPKDPLNGAATVHFYDVTRSGWPSSQLAGLTRTIAQYVKEGSNVKSFYIGIASGSDMLSALKLRYDVVNKGRAEDGDRIRMAHQRRESARRESCIAIHAAYDKTSDCSHRTAASDRPSSTHAIMAIFATTAIAV